MVTAAASAAVTTQQETVFWQSIADSENASDYQAYLQQYPTGAFARLAENRLAELEPGRSSEPIRASDLVRPPAKIHDIPPVYPRAAQEDGVQGVVILEVTIGPTGEVSNITVLRSVPRSVPLLDEAAITAVKQWRYEPTLVDGAPVAVVMTVTVSFYLS